MFWPSPEAPGTRQLITLLDQVRVARAGRAVSGWRRGIRCTGPELVLILDWFQKMDETHGVPTTSWFDSMLRRAGPRVTRPRLAVLAAVQDHPHADTDSIFGAADTHRT
jgi:hypothetical protein